MKTIRSKILLSFCLLLISFGSIFSAIYYYNLRREIIGGFDERLRSQANAIVALIDVEVHESLHDEAQMGSEDYQRLYRQINGLMKRNGLAYIFTIRRQNGGWVYVIDSGEGENHLSTGTAYNEGEPLDPDEQAALCGETVVSGIYTSRFGTFKSAYAPLHDASGAIVGLLVVDIEASSITASLRGGLYTLASILLGLLLLAILAAGVVSNSITRPLHRMAGRARRVSEGELDTPMGFRRRDEIGTLSDAFDSMLGRLKSMITEKESAARKLERFNASLEELVAQRTQDLADSEARFRFLTEQALVGIYLIQDGVFRYVNPMVEKISGHRVEDLIGMDVKRIIHPDDLGTFSERMRQRMSGESDDSHYVLRLINKDGSVSTTEVFGARIDFEGRPAIYGTARDITEQVRLEEQLRHSERLDVLGQIAGGIAHEFNNLLSPILGYAALLKNRLAELNRENLLRPLELIEKAGQRATSLVGEILTFARETDCQLSPVNCNDIVEETLALLRQTFPRTITIVKDLQPDLPLVEAEAGQMQSALLNLCLNARDAMPGGGTLTISTREVAFRGDDLPWEPGRPSGPHVLVSVRDSGMGMDKTTAAKVFDPFFTTRRGAGGSGLGLATVYGTVQSHKGQLTVESEEGLGSLFSIYLPVTDRVIEPPAVAEIKVLQGGEERLLVVDDDEDVRSLYTDLLRDLGYTVVQAEDGAGALDKLRVSPVGLVVLDLNMPRMDGRETFRRIRRLDPELPVLITSGLADLNDGQFAPDARLRILQKPLRIEIMAQTVRELLDA